MANDIESVEGVGAIIVADVQNIVARRLREKYLHDFIRVRNELLLLDRPNDTETMRLLRRPCIRELEKRWDGALQTLRSELPKTLDQLFTNLQPEFQEAAGLPVSPLDPTAAPLPVSTEIRNVTDYTFEPIPAKAAGVSVTTSPTVNRARSITLAPNTAAFEEDEAQSTAIEAENPVFDSTDEPSNKRALDPEEAEITCISKKAKKTPQTHNRTPRFKIPIKRSMYFQDVKQGECIFSSDGYSGVYILRCNLVKCKKRLKQDGPIIFTSHPFRNGLALDHFNGDGHSIDSEAEIFRKFAVRITDTSAERNTEKDHDSVFDSSCSEVDLASPSASPKKSRDKGKRPERPYNMYSSRRPEASTSESASKSTETFRDSFYRAGPLPSIPDSTLPSEDSGELLPGASRNEQGAD
ncbi:hypothetical protein F5B21DRAFT_525991 [Xylaria acuta]|nr:hypothetical protein F5B21DRAFT_525991 [Xylaria acuta]